MTELQFYFQILLSIWERVAVACVTWVNELFEASYAMPFYLSCISIFFMTKFLIVPLVGRSMGTGRSDTVKRKFKSEE